MRKRRGPRPVDERRGRGPDQRINDRIRVREVLLIDEKGENLGVKTADDAREYAYNLNLDLVEISPQARPPVCRVMDFGKWKYEQDMKTKQARKARTTVTIKEIKFRPKIGEADYVTKRNHVRRFLEAANKVKVTIMFRGREVVHSNLGEKILRRVEEDCADIGVVEQQPNLEGRNMTMVIAPTKAKLREIADEAGDATDVEVEIDLMAVPESATELPADDEA